MSQLNANQNKVETNVVENQKIESKGRLLIVKTGVRAGARRMSRIRIFGGMSNEGSN